MLALVTWFLGGCAAEAPPTAKVHTGDAIPGQDERPPLELCINEFMADNEDSWQDETGASSDWIELHNPSSVDVGLGDYELGDAEGDGVALDASLSIPAGGFLVLVADGQPELGSHHLPFSLSADGETLALVRSDGAGERVSYGAVEADFSWSRVGDCCAGIPDCFTPVWRGTPDASNGGP